MTNREIRYYYTLEELFEDFDLEAVQAFATAQTNSAPVLEEVFGDVLDILNDEYYDWFVGFIDKPAAMPITDTQTPSVADIAALKKKFIRKLITKYNFTKDRYIYLLNLYVEQKTHLMDKLSSITQVEESGENETLTTRTDNLANSRTVHQTGTDTVVTDEEAVAEHRVNDTPQNGGDWSNDNHTSTYEKTDTDLDRTVTDTKNLTDTETGTNTGTQTTGVDGSNSKTVDTTVSTDPMTIMARINEIQDHYMNVLKNWCKEFDQLFIAPNNEFESEE